jgi:hypothetical protein
VPGDILGVSPDTTDHLRREGVQELPTDKVRYQDVAPPSTTIVWPVM